MDAVSSSEMLVNYYQTTWHHFPADSTLQNMHLLRKLPMQDMQFSQRCCWKFMSYGMLQHVNHWTDANISMDCSTFKMSVTVYQPTQCNIPENLNPMPLSVCTQSLVRRCLMTYNKHNAVTCVWTQAQWWSPFCGTDVLSVADRNSLQSICWHAHAQALLRSGHHTQPLSCVPMYYVAKSGQMECLHLLPSLALTCKNTQCMCNHLQVQQFNSVTHETTTL
jgi:hypothetical protein